METVERNEDMSPSGKLRLHQQNDGDIIVAIVPDLECQTERMSIEFCAMGCGGGRSPKTLEALRKLMTAMEEDNADSPIASGV